MSKQINITDAEWNIMQVLWSQDSATTSEITAELQRDRTVSTQTVKTLLRRLINKELVGYEVDTEDSRVYHYCALVDRDEAIRQKSEAFISQVYQSDAVGFLSHFVENNKVSKDELVRLQGIIAKRLLKQ